ncbi:MAG: hypothetical protein ACXWUD_02595 [Methylosarcina sp.]
MNNYFQTGTFNGFNIEGRCKIIQNISHYGQTWFSESGHYMALLDDPRLVDNDGRRFDDSQVPIGYSSRRTAVINFSFHPDAKAKTTHAVDGAWLQKTGITLQQNQGIRIVWNFLIGDRIPGFNDFLLLEIHDDNNSVLHQEVLYQATEKLFDWASGWRSTDWICTGDSTISVKVSVANGYQTNPDIQAGPDTLKNATRYPSGLLVDCIEIIGA